MDSVYLLSNLTKLTPNIMKTLKNRTQKIILAISFLLITSAGFAQLPAFNDDVNDSSPAPISSIVAFGLIVGAAYGIKKMK